MNESFTRKSYSSQQTHMLNLYLISMWKETLIFALSLESVPYFHPPHCQPSTGFHLFFSPSPRFISRTHKSSLLKSSGVMPLSLTRAKKPGFYSQACPPFLVWHPRPPSIHLLFQPLASLSTIVPHVCSTTLLTIPQQCHVLVCLWSKA